MASKSINSEVCSKRIFFYHMANCNVSIY